MPRQLRAKTAALSKPSTTRTELESLARARTTGALTLGARVNYLANQAVSFSNPSARTASTQQKESAA